jgi:hypothetical protein
MRFVPHRKYTYRPSLPVTGIVFFYNFITKAEYFIMGNLYGISVILVPAVLVFQEVARLP